MSTLFRAGLALAVGLLLAATTVTPAVALHPDWPPQPFQASDLGEDGCTLFETTGYAQWKATHSSEEYFYVAVRGEAPVVSVGAPCLPVVSADRQIEFTAYADDAPVAEHIEPFDLASSSYDYQFAFPESLRIDYLTVAVCLERPDDGSTWTDRCSEEVTLYPEGESDPDEAPDPPTGLVATHIGLTSVTLEWDLVPGVALGHTVYREGHHPVTILGGNSYTDTGLTPDTEYTYTVTAFYGAGDEGPFGPESEPSEPLTVKTDAPEPVDELVPVSNLEAISIGTTTVGLRWDEPPWLNDIQVRRDGVEVAVLESSSVVYTDTGLEPGTEYSYEVTAVPEEGQTAFSATLTATTHDAPPGPDCTASLEVISDWGSAFQANVTITNAGDSAADGWAVTWDWPGDQQVTQSWNVDLTQTGSTVDAHDVGWNSLLAPGESTTSGLIAEPTIGQATPPSLECTLAS